MTNSFNVSFGRGESHVPAKNLTPNQTLMGMMPWWMTWSLEMCLSFFRSTKNICSMRHSLGRPAEHAHGRGRWSSTPGGECVHGVLAVTHRIKELCELGEVVPPASGGHPHGLGGGRVVDGLAPQAVPVEPTGGAGLQQEKVRSVGCVCRTLFSGIHF